MSQGEMFLREIGVKAPILLAPMAGVSTPALAAAVTAAGGLGSLGLAGRSPAQVRALVTETRALAAGPLNLNFFCHRPPRRDAAAEAAWIEYLQPLFHRLNAGPPSVLSPVYESLLGDDLLGDDEMFELLLELRPAVVSFHFGRPGPERIAELRAAGIRTIGTATSVPEAADLVSAGVDAVLAQGIEAGGHRGVFDPDAVDEALPLAELVPRVVEAVDAPVIAAGGIMDGRDARAVLDLGACAAQFGTAFVAAPESAANAVYRDRLLGRGDQGADRSTRLTRVFSGRPARGMVNRFLDFATAPGAPEPPDFPVAYDANKRLGSAAAQLGLAGYAPYWAGTGVTRVRELPAGELVAQLLAELG